VQGGLGRLAGLTRVVESMLYSTLRAEYSQACFTWEVAMASVAYPPYAIRGIVSGQWVYWCTLGMAAWSYAYMPRGSIRTALIVTPILPALLIVAVAYWVYQACDEYVRSRILKGIAITAVIVAFCSFSYFVLELFGLPRLSMLWINLLGWSIFNLQMLYVIVRSR
jgi:hypothetical protein